MLSRIVHGRLLDTALALARRRAAWVAGAALLLAGVQFSSYCAIPN